MKLIKIKLNAFAGVINKSYIFNEGLNVIKGPNEGGKSTLIKAIQSALLVKTDLTENNLNKLMGDCFPINTNNSKGDSISIELTFESDAVVYKLYKTWKVTNHSSKLIKGNDAPIENEANVQALLDTLIKVNKASLKDVLFVNQSKIAKTLELLNNPKDSDANEIKANVDSIIINAIMNTANIQPQDIIAKLEYNRNSISQNWDFDNNAPVIGGDGLGSYDYPRTQSRGKILILAYEIHNHQKELDAVISYDNKLDELVNSIRSLRISVNEDLLYISDTEPQIESFKRTSGLLAEKQLLVDQQASLMNKQNTWVNCENQLPALEQQINDYTLQLQSIDSELKNSKSRAGAINLINEFNRASDLNTQFIAANLALSNTPQITNTNLTDVETIQNDLNIKKSNLDALNNAQKYIIQVEALQTNNLVVTKENLPDENIQLLPNSPIDIDCSGTVKLSTNSVKIKIKPSVEKILQLENDIKNFELKLKEIFISYKVDSMDALRALNNNYNTAMQVKSSRNTELQAVLNGRSLEALKAEVDSINNLPLTRGVEELTDLKNSITTQLNQSKIAVNKHKLELENLKKQYQGVIDIVQAIATKINEISAKQAQIDGLAAIPDGINFDTLNTTFETRKERYNTNSVSLTDKLTQKQILEGNPINYTTEEKEQEINDKTRQKESLIQEAISLKSALDKLKNILLNAQNAPYINYHNKLNTYLNTLSGGKYVFHSEQKLAPNMVVNVAENKELPFQLLSQGTSGIMGLAVRLSMADYLLENNDGFLVFDDPMVDFDEGRQQNAVSCFEDYAENKQVLIFTCHNSHASQFTRGNIINI